MAHTFSKGTEHRSDDLINRQEARYQRRGKAWMEEMSRLNYNCEKVKKFIQTNPEFEGIASDFRYQSIGDECLLTYASHDRMPTAAAIELDLNFEVRTSNEWDEDYGYNNIDYIIYGSNDSKIATEAEVFIGDAWLTMSTSERADAIAHLESRGMIGDYQYDCGGKVGKMEDGGEVKNWEIIVTDKELLKDGGRKFTHRYLIQTQNLDEAKKVAIKKWRSEWDEYDLSIESVLSDEEWRKEKGLFDVGGFIAPLTGEASPQFDVHSPLFKDGGVTEHCTCCNCRPKMEDGGEIHYKDLSSNS